MRKDLAPEVEHDPLPDPRHDELLCESKGENECGHADERTGEPQELSVGFANLFDAGVVGRSSSQRAVERVFDEERTDES